jgi:hypothetical protein
VGVRDVDRFYLNHEYEEEYVMVLSFLRRKNTPNSVRVA